MSTYLIWSLVKPSQILIYCAVMGLIMYRKLAGKVLQFITAAILVTCTLLPVGSLIIYPLESRIPSPAISGMPDGIIVLAGSEISDLSATHGIPMLNHGGDRLTTFLILAHRFPRARLAHVGAGTSYHGVNQSDVARQLILGVGIDSSRIYFINHGHNTCSDALDAFNQLQPNTQENWYLITSAYHIPRAVSCFQAIGWNVTAYPTDYRSTHKLQSHSLLTNLSLIDLATYEWAALAYYRLKGDIPVFFL